MELEALKVFIGAFGGSGVSLFFAWLFFRSWQEANARTYTVMNARIDALEKATADCSADRSALHRQMFELQNSKIGKNTQILHKVLKHLEPETE